MTNSRRYQSPARDAVQYSDIIITVPGDKIVFNPPRTDMVPGFTVTEIPLTTNGVWMTDRIFSEAAK